MVYYKIGGGKINNYDFIYILDPSLGDDRLKEIIQRISSIVGEKGGEVVSCEVWGRRRMAYSIAKKRDGFFVYMNIKSPPPAINHLKKEVKLTEGLVRLSIIRADSKK